MIQQMLPIWSLALLSFLNPVCIYGSSWFMYCWSLAWRILSITFSSVQFSCSVMSDCLWPQEPQHARPPCPSPTTGVHPNLCPFSRWCHPTISSSVIPFSSCPQSFPASGSFPTSQLFASGGQTAGAPVSASVFVVNIQGRFPLGLIGLVSLQSKGLLRV